MGNIFLKILLIVLLDFMAIAACAAVNYAGNNNDVIQGNSQPVSYTSTAQKVQVLAESQTAPGDSFLSKTEQFYKYGEKLFDAGDYLNALKYFYAVTKAEPKNIKSWKKTAFCYYKLKKHNYAYNAFKIVLKYDSSDKDALEFMDYYKTIIDKRVKAGIIREPFDSIWRAAVLPGFGQIYNNQTVKGIIVSGAFIVAAGLSVYNVIDEKAKYEKYKITNENQDIAFKQAQESWTSALIWGILAGAVYAGGIVDAGLNYNCDEVKSAGIYIKDNAVYVAAGYRW